jgi:hypothetical protein
MSKEFQADEVKELLDYLATRLFHVENFYLIYCELGLHYNKRVSEDSAKAYLKVINSNKGFFLPVQEALRSTLTVELYTFIVSKDYKSLPKAIEHLKSINGPDLSSEYGKLKQNNQNIFKHLTKFRNGYYAHKTNAKLGKLPSSSDREFQQLFQDTKNLLNSASSYFDKSHWFLDGISRQSIKDTHDMMDNLLRGEAQRLSEIDVDLVSNLYQDGKRKWLAQE